MPPIVSTSLHHRNELDRRGLDHGGGRVAFFQGQIFAGPGSDEGFQCLCARNQISAKKAAMSRARRSGSSAAPKCPPLGMEVHRRTS